MTRKEFITQVGGGAAGIFFTACLAGCRKKSTASATSPQGPSHVNFTIDISSGPLSANGGYLVKNGVIVGRTTSGSFVAIAASCTHEGTNLQYSASSNKFTCPSHGAQFDASGNVLNGPATVAEKKYNTSLSGNILTVTGG